MSFRINVTRGISLLIFAVCVIYLLKACQLHFGTFHKPGVGFLPVLSGAAAALLSLYHLVQSFREEFADQAVNWRKIGVFGLSLTVYALVVDAVGYAVATAGLLLVLIKLFGGAGWLRPVIVAVLAAYGSFFIFSELLAVPLP